MLVFVVLLTGAGVASAQKKCDPEVDKDCRAAKPQKPPPTHTFKPLDVSGKLRGAMLLQFLERANEELERASLERRSFVPELVRSVELEAL